jgi:hypothetical protein
MQGDEPLSQEDVTYYISRIKEGNPDTEQSRALLRLFCVRAKELKFPDSPFPDALLELLIAAFEGYLSGDQKDLEKSLGLKRRGRPVNPEIVSRNKLIAADVIRIVLEKNKPLADNSKEQGAFSIVAESYELSDSEVRDIYYKHENDGLAIILCERLT